MGKYWLHDLVAPLSKALGDKLVLYPGYETRSRSTGGFDNIWGIVNHHDADGTSGQDITATNYCAIGSPDRPVGNFHVHRDGKVFFFAAGASNHAGKGGPVKTSKGTVGQDLGNKNLIGIEASNNGVGESWPDVQIQSIITLDVVICKWALLDPLQDIFTHNGWCEPSTPGRKIDPFGPVPKYKQLGSKIWPQAEWRKIVNAQFKASLPQPPAPTTDWAALGKTYTTTPPTLRYGDVSPNVPWLQAILSSMNTIEDNKPIYNPLWVGADIVNGVEVKNGFGDATKNAVVYWQSKNGLTANGVYDTLTANRMLQVRGK